MPRRPHLPLVPLILGASLVLVAFLALSIGRNVVRHYQLREDERALRSELQQLDADAVELAAVRDYLKSDEYIEDVARRVIGLVRPGETLVIVSGTEPSPTPERSSSIGAPWWKDLFIAPLAAPTASAPPPAP